MGPWVLSVLACSKFGDVAFEPGLIHGTGTVTFSSKKGGEAYVRAEAADGTIHETPVIAAAADTDAPRSIPVLGLRPGQAHNLVVVVDDGGNAVESDPLEVTIDPPSQGVPALSVNVWEPSKACDEGGYVLFSYIGADKSGVAIIDRDGKYLWSVASPAGEQVGRVRPGRDGQSILWNIADEKKRDDIAKVIRTSLDGSAVTETRTLNGHHDFVELPNGRIGWMSYRFEDAAIPNDFGIGETCIAADTILEANEGITEADTPDVIYDTWDDYPQGVYVIPESSVNESANGPSPAFLPDCYEFGHGNSLAYRESDDSYFMMFRWLDTLIKADRTAGHAWQMGGAYNDLAGASEDLFFHAHFSDLWDGGMLVFDNRTPELKSQLVEYTFDDAQFDQVWSYQSDKFENLLGDVRRIPIDGCDNLLVSWSGQGRISEITREGEIVWDVSASQVGSVTSRVNFLPDLYDFAAPR